MYEVNYKQFNHLPILTNIYSEILILSTTYSHISISDTSISVKILYVLWRVSLPKNTKDCHVLSVMQYCAHDFINFTLISDKFLKKRLFGRTLAWREMILRTNNSF